MDGSEKAEECTVAEDLRVVVETIFVVVTIVATVVVVIEALVSWGPWYCRIAAGDGNAARRTAATMRTLTRCAAFSCMLVHAHDTSTCLCKHIDVQDRFRIVLHRNMMVSLCSLRDGSCTYLFHHTPSPPPRHSPFSWVWFLWVVALPCVAG